MAAESKAAVVPRRQVPRLCEPEDQAALAMLMAKQVALEAGNMAELEHEIAVAEPEYEASVAEVIEVPRLELAMLPKRWQRRAAGRGSGNLMASWIHGLRQ